jgi:hypothetical protein
MIQGANEILAEQIQQVAACHALHNAESRLARWLLQTHDYAGNDLLDLTQDFVSEMIGVRRTTVVATRDRDRDQFVDQLSIPPLRHVAATGRMHCPLRPRWPWRSTRSASYCSRCDAYAGARRTQPTCSSRCKARPLADVLKVPSGSAFGP